MGSVTPGKCADIVLLDDLSSFFARKVFVDGGLVAEDWARASSRPRGPTPGPTGCTHTMNLGLEPTAENLPL